MPVEFVFGKVQTHARQGAVRRLVHGDIDVLIANVIFQEGIDIPELQSVVNAAGGKSTIAAVQTTGRGMRRHDSTGRETKAEFFVYDVADRSCGCRYRGSDGKARYGHAGCRWAERHTRGRMLAYRGEGYEVTEVDGRLYAGRRLV
jgi:superfamily II DNA or RNA helicase